MQNFVSRVISWHTRLSMRERVLVGLGVIAAVWMLWLFAVWDVIEAGFTDAETDLKRVQNQLAAARQSQYSEAQESLKVAALNQEIARLTAEITAGKQALESAMTAFVKPDDISVVLRDVLATNHGVELVTLKSLPPEAISVADAVVFYQHPLIIELEGSFPAIYAYLDAIEERSEVISFHSLEYEVLKHPRASARIEVSTVSRSKEWLGV